MKRVALGLGVSVLLSIAFAPITASVLCRKGACEEDFGMGGLFSIVINFVVLILVVPILMHLINFPREQDKGLSKKHLFYYYLVIIIIVILLLFYFWGPVGLLFFVTHPSRVMTLLS